jgi:acylphosphatase
MSGNFIMIAKEIRVVGKVQRVSFRAATRAKALSLGIVGWVRNNTDGSVQIRIEGEEAIMASMLEWCRVGPPLARVDVLEEKPAPVVGFEGFMIIC